MSASQTIVLITGANSGIGYATTTVLAKASRNYHVILGSRNPENGERAADEIRALEGIQGTISTVQIDQDDASSIRNAAKAVDEQFGRVDVLINNAGIVDFEKDFEAAMARVYKTNAIGPALVFNEFKPMLMKSKSPYSIYVTSGLGSKGLVEEGKWPEVIALSYRMSKAALNMWAAMEHQQFSKDGLKTFVMCPGLVVSNLRGKSDAARQAGGHATSPIVSGETILSIIEGKRDADAGKFVHKDGLYPW